MSHVVFNFHDVVLWMTCLQCVLFALLLVLTDDRHRLSTCFLAAFIAAHALIPLHELILWAEEFRLRVREHAPGLYYVFGAAYYVDGAFLFFCIKALIYKDFRLRLVDGLHALPLLVFGLFMWMTYFRFDVSVRLDMIDSQAFVYGAPWIRMDFACKAMRFAYALVALVLLLNYRQQLKSTHSNVQRRDLIWVSLLVMGFLFVMSLDLLLAGWKLLVTSTHGIPAFKYLGLASYYSTFVLVNMLVFTAVRYFAGFRGVEQKAPPLRSADRLLNPELAEHVDALMNARKPYIEPDLTLDHLAEMLDIGPRDLSRVINRHFGVNFYEFINRYRIEEVKRQLVDAQYKDEAISAIYTRAGFNSKSVFNTFFKRLVGMTPSQYRKVMQESGSPR